MDLVVSLGENVCKKSNDSTGDHLYGLCALKDKTAAK